MSCKPPVSYADPRDVAQLAEPLRSRIAQLIADAPTGGLILVSGRRSPWQQWVLRHDRCPGRECDPSCKGHPTTALPYRSNHQKGTAADVGGRDLRWAIANAAAYGLFLAVPGENWHFEATATAPTVPVAPFGTSTPVDPNAGRSWAPFRLGDTDATIYARGGHDNEVSELQIRLKILAKSWNAPGLDPGPINGNYGPTTAKAVVRFKARIRRLQLATHQTPWPAHPDTVVGPATIAMLRWWTA